MKLPQDTHEKMMSAYQLLGQDMLSISAFESIRVLVKGIHPEIDKKLDIASKALTTVEKIIQGDVISLSAEHLPEGSEKEKKRKKALLFFISSVKDLHAEIKRVDGELSSGNNTNWHIGRIIKYAKGPFGLITVAAVIIVGFILLTHKNPTQPVLKSTKRIQVILYNGKQIPLIQFFIGHGSDCDSPHYHAIGEATVTALDGTVIQDPGGCGFGKVKDVQVTTITQ